jgi:hypothetical protein
MHESSAKIRARRSDAAQAMNLATAARRGQAPQARRRPSARLLARKCIDFGLNMPIAQTATGRHAI